MRRRRRKKRRAKGKGKTRPARLRGEGRGRIGAGVSEAGGRFKAKHSFFTFPGFLQITGGGGGCTVSTAFMTGS